MSSRSWMPALLLLCANLAWAGDCEPAVDASTPEARSVAGQRLVLPGTPPMEISLGEGAMTFAHLPDMLLVRYGDGAALSHRLLDESELRAQSPNPLPLAEFVRLIFTDAAQGASARDREEATAYRAALQVGCTAFKRYRVGRVDVFGYAQVRANGEHYQALFILDDERVHFIDIIGDEQRAADVLASLRQRR